MRLTARGILAAGKGNGLRWLTAWGLAVLATACSSGSGNTASAPVPQTLAVSVAGLNAGANFVLQDNAGDEATISSVGTTAFKTTLAAGAAYTLSVTSQPSNEFCNVQNPSGTVGSATAGAITVTCAQVLAGGSGQIQVSGGTVTTAAADLTVPANASLQPQNVTISIVEPPAGIPSLFTPVGAAVDVAIDQPTALNEPFLVTLRYDASIVPDESNLVVIHYNTATHSYEPVTILSQDTIHHAFTIATRVFSPFEVVQFTLSDLPASHMVSNFSVANNGWNINNFGSYFSSSGNCLGMAAYAIWYFENQTAAALNGHFSAAGNPSIAQIVAARAQIAESQFWAKLTAGEESVLLGQAQIGKYMKTYLAAFDKPMVLILQPSQTTEAEHASVVYGYDATQFTFYDVNFMNAVQSLPFNGTQFGTYRSYAGFSFLAAESLGRTQDFGQLTSDADSGFIYSHHITVTSPADFTTPITSPPITVAGSLSAGLAANAKLIGYFPPQTEAALLASAPGTFSYSDTFPMLGDNTIVLLAGVDVDHQNDWHPSSDTYIFDLNYQVDGLIIPANATIGLGQNQVFTMTVSGKVPPGATYNWTFTGVGSLSSNVTTTPQVTFTAGNTAGQGTLSAVILDAQGNTLSKATASFTIGATGCYGATASISNPGSTYSVTLSTLGGGTEQSNYVWKGSTAFADPPYSNTGYEYDVTSVYTNQVSSIGNGTTVVATFGSAKEDASYVIYGVKETSTDSSGNTTQISTALAPPLAFGKVSQLVAGGPPITLQYVGVATTAQGTAPVNYSASWQLLSTPTIIVPAGTFKTCAYQVISSDSPNIIDTKWKLYGYGFEVQETLTDTSSGTPVVQSTTQATAISINGVTYTGP